MELVAGIRAEYSGFRWALFFLAENPVIIVIGALCVTLLFGGWLQPPVSRGLSRLLE